MVDPLESRVQSQEQPVDNPRLRWLDRLANSRWLMAVPIVGLGVVGVQSYRYIPKLVADTRAYDTFRTTYGDVRGGAVDVNKDGQYEYGITFRNSKGELEQWVYDTENGQRFLKRVAEVKDGKIVYDRTISLN